MKNKLWKIMIASGTMLIFSALFLYLYNVRENHRAMESSKKVVCALKEQIPESVSEDLTESQVTLKHEDLFLNYEQENVKNSPMIEYEGKYYCGYITIPALEIELPILSDWSYSDLKNSPCCYSGSIYENNMIIAAHNYNSHFGKIKKLNSDDEIIFTDCGGNVYRYKVINTEYVAGIDLEGMLDGQAEEWDLTLFTCTLDGKSRVAVRAINVQE